ncbi:eCIS core domain-containing protein [Nostoc sp.]|uniref:eCIS core domain-containing protein n=1 Tax=Nostoc sp. TaxID=1180 RepID=UPI002FFA56E3
MPDEEELRMTSEGSIQQKELPEEEKKQLQMKPLGETPPLQREELPDEEDELQMKPMVQPVTGGGMAASPNLSADIQRARGSGQPLADSIRVPMEQAFGADFSGVRIHTGSQANQLNQSIQAKAFTTGQDVFFRQGTYEPRSQGGQELLAHELTHVVQQSGGAVQRETTVQGKLRDTIKPPAYQQAPVYSPAISMAQTQSIQCLRTTNELKSDFSQRKLMGLFNKPNKDLQEVFTALDAYHTHYKANGVISDDSRNREEQGESIKTYLGIVLNKTNTYVDKHKKGKKTHDIKELLTDSIKEQRNIDEVVHSPQYTNQEWKDVLPKWEELKFKEIEKQKPKTKEDLDKIADQSTYKYLSKIVNQDLYGQEYRSSSKTTETFMNTVLEDLSERQEKLKTLKNPEEIAEQEEWIKMLKEKIIDQKIKFNPDTGKLETDVSKYKVEYLTTEHEQNQFRLTITGGQLYQNKLKFDTTNMFTTFQGRGWSLYVMDPNGEFYAGSSKVGLFHHSSFLAGGAVAGAGELKTDSSGSLKQINNKSGHYQPDQDQMFQVLTQLKNKGVDLNIPLFLMNQTDTYPGGAANFYKDYEKAEANDKKRRKESEIRSSIPRTDQDLNEIAKSSLYKDLLKVEDQYINQGNEEFVSSEKSVLKNAKQTIEELIKLENELKELEESINLEDLNEQRKILLEKKIAGKKSLKAWYLNKLEDQGFKLKDSSTKEVDESQFANYKTQYLTTQPEREQFHLSINSKFSQNGKPFNTTNMYTAFWGRGAAIYVMDPNGEFYANSHKIGQFHHSSFFAGGAVAGAGELKTDSSGELQAISNKTGHYHTGEEHIFQVLEELKKHNVDIKVPLLLVAKGNKDGKDHPGGAEKFYTDKKLEKEQAENKSAEESKQKVEAKNNDSHERTHKFDDEVEGSKQEIKAENDSKIDVDDYSRTHKFGDEVEGSKQEVEAENDSKIDVDDYSRTHKFGDETDEYKQEDDEE